MARGKHASNDQKTFSPFSIEIETGVERKKKKVAFFSS